MNKLFIFIIKSYKFLVSPVLEIMFGKACRFTPTCSQYTIEALGRFGTVKGLWLGLKRLSKCHPFGESGYDGVPNNS